MSIAALNWAFSLRGVSISQKVVLISLANFSDESGYSFPAIKTIAEISCMSDSSVRRALSDLCERGILRIDHRFRADGSQTSSGYFLMIAPPVNLTPPPVTMTGPPVTGDTPYNHQITTTLTDDKSSVCKPKRKSRIKPDWSVTDQDREYARSKGLSEKDIENEEGKFREWYLSSGAAWLDWGIVWKRWVGRCIERSAKQAAGADTYRDRSQSTSLSGEAVRIAKTLAGASDAGRAGHGYDPD
jgi:hypothetical protein